MHNSKKPILTKDIKIDDFESYYWLKSELSKFCSICGLSTDGSKTELIDRIKIFITVGKKINISRKLPANRDSDSRITREMVVVNYKNDAITRDFFISQIGSHFHFNAYLRQFTDPGNLVDKNLTYGDLVNGWQAVEAKKNSMHVKSIIGDQFEYNQFIRDYFANEKDQTLADAIKAWNVVKNLPGPNSYKFYREKGNAI